MLSRISILLSLLIMGSNFAEAKRTHSIVRLHSEEKNGKSQPQAVVAATHNNSQRNEASASSSVQAEDGRNQTKKPATVAGWIKRWITSIVFSPMDNIHWRKSIDQVERVAPWKRLLGNWMNGEKDGWLALKDMALSQRSDPDELKELSVAFYEIIVEHLDVSDAERLDMVAGLNPLIKLAVARVDEDTYCVGSLMTPEWALTTPAWTDDSACVEKFEKSLKIAQPRRKVNQPGWDLVARPGDLGKLPAMGGGCLCFYF